VQVPVFSYILFGLSQFHITLAYILSHENVMYVLQASFLKDDHLHINIRCIRWAKFPKSEKRKHQSSALKTSHARTNIASRMDLPAYSTTETEEIVCPSQLHRNSKPPILLTPNLIALRSSKKTISLARFLALCCAQSQSPNHILSMLISPPPFKQHALSAISAFITKSPR